MPCFEKSHPVDDDAGRKAWSLAHPWCMACGQTERSGPQWALHTHHILGGKHGRSDESCNFLRLHGQCHDLCHGMVIRTKTGPIEKLTLGMQLTIKRDRDPETWNPERLRELRRPWSLPDCEPLPEWCVEDWRTSKAHRLMAGWQEPKRKPEMAVWLPMELVTWAQSVAKAERSTAQAIIAGLLEQEKRKRSA